MNCQANRRGYLLSLIDGLPNRFFSVGVWLIGLTILLIAFRLTRSVFVVALLLGHLIAFFPIYVAAKIQDKQPEV